MSDNFFSQATNFQSSATGSVDPRTGLFNCTMPLAHLIGNTLLGPELTLTLSYSPLNPMNIGFGVGFSLGLTHYDRENRLLMLSTGERYKVYETDDSVSLKQYKQDVVRFEKDVTKNVYRVIHKSGLMEILSGPLNAYNLKIPMRIINPLGHSLKLAWNYEIIGLPRLATISDDNQTLLNIDYQTGIYTDMTVWPESTESYTIRLIFENDRVTQIRNNVDQQTLSWGLEYKSDSGFLTRIASPTGFVEFVAYNSDGHQFPDEAGLPPLPYVTQYTQQTKNSPDVIRYYKYTESNFLGYENQESWKEDEDYLLYGKMTYYLYGSTEYWNNGSEQRHIIRRYNSYHLLVTENVQQNSCQRQHETHYYAQIGQEFAQQPPQFQLPKSATVRFITQADQPDDAPLTREETTQTEFDTAGNPTVQIAPDGTRTEWVYYPAEGETSTKDNTVYCPADPHGFVRYLKSKKIIPPPVTGYDDVPVHQEIYRYASLPTRPDSLTDHAVVCTRQEVYSDETLLHTRQTEYRDQPEDPHHGRVDSVVETVYSLQDPASAQPRSPWNSQKTFVYALNAGQLRCTTQWCGHDGLTLSSVQEKSCLSGKIGYQQNPQGCTTHYLYDALGRLLTQKDNANTDYAREKGYTYALEAPGVVTTTQTDVWGNQVRCQADGRGQVYQLDILAKKLDILAKEQATTDWYLLSKNGRDSWGRVVTQSHHDTLPTGPDPAQPDTVKTCSISLNQQITYDDWGQPSLITSDTGQRSRQVFNPVTQITRCTTEVDGLTFGYTETAYNLRHQPLTVTLYDSQGQFVSQQQNEYDGLGRLRATVDALAQKTQYTYDAFHRVATITYSDGTVVQKRYASFSTDNLVTQIVADGKVLGQRVFDSLHRVTSVTVGGRTHQATYTCSNPAPETVTDPLKQTVHQQYEPRLGNALLQRTTAGITQTFSYDAKTGAMINAVTEKQVSQQCEYTPAGLLRQETTTFNDTGVARHTQYTYSPGGQLTACQDVTGTRRQRYFDTQGRPVMITDSAINVTMSYDAASRLNCWTVHDNAQSQSLTTTLTWDDLGRETERRIDSGTDVLTLTQTYTVIGLLASRETRSQQAGLLRQESYTYDVARRWLTDYQCSGTECPQDAYGMSLRRQQFTYDRLGNMLTCVTTLADNSRDTATFTYSPSDPCQLYRITHTHPAYPAKITLTYDAGGRLIQDESGNQLTYDALGRLISVTLKEKISTYGYDAANRLVLHRLDNTGTQELYYQGNARVAEVQRESGTATRLVHANGTPAAVIAGDKTHLLGTDGQGSLLIDQPGSGTPTRYRYTPYGQQAADEQNTALPGYTGERADPTGGGYHLGNGYRTYSPVLMRFTAPDSLSPFGAGGLNPYAYCLGDPVNHSDPSGHMSWSSIFGIVLGTVGLLAGLAMAIPTGGASLSIDGAIIAGIGFLGDATSIASAATEESNPQASAILGWASLGLGALSLGSGLLGGLTRGMRQVGEQLSDSFAHGLSGRGAAQAGSSSHYAVTTAETEYTRNFRKLMNLGGSELIDNQMNTIQIDWNTTRPLIPKSEHMASYNTLLKLGLDESPSGSNVWKLKTDAPGLDRMIGGSHHVNITRNIYEKLYLPFINDATSVTHASKINNIRAIIDHHILNRIPFDANIMNSIRIYWSASHYSGTFKDWLVAEMVLRFPNNEQNIRATSNVIYMDNAEIFASFYNFYF
ncbi:RHS repeat domain-containing protein [Xenorhabdus stockiae]|uniref:RHS repeat domain-containing protein n=1 Tax=Xenorhabdus stockiae TaxID=351614 RepID=UPI004063A516